MVHVNLILERIPLVARKLTRKKMMFGAILIVVIGILTLAGWLLWPKPSQEDDTSTATSMSVEDVRARGMDYAAAGDIDGGLKYYDGQIEGRTNDKEKQQLLISKANFALKVNKNNEALEAAKQADSIKSDSASVQILAQVYGKLGDKKQAITYYKKLLELSSKDGADSRYNATWQQMIEELEK